MGCVGARRWRRGPATVTRTALVGRLRETPTLLQRSRATDRITVWGAVLARSLRHPRRRRRLAAGAVVLALPALGMHTKLLGFSRPAPEHPASSRPTTRSRRRSRAPRTPAHVVVIRATDVDDAAVRQRRSREFKRRALASGADPRSRSESRSTRRAHVARVEIPLAGERQDATVDARARRRCAPRCFRRALGDAAADTQLRGHRRDRGQRRLQPDDQAHCPLVFAFVLGLAFLLLLVTFRSLVIPLTSIVLNLLSVGAAYGVLVWIFQTATCRAARLPLQRRGRHLAAAVPVRGAVRALDGLPRVHRQPDQGAASTGAADRRGGRRGHPLDRRTVTAARP